MLSLLFWPLFVSKTALVVMAGFFGSLAIFLENLSGLLAIGPRFREPSTLLLAVRVNNALQYIAAVFEAYYERVFMKLPWVAHRSRLAVVTCMDARFNVARTVGDTRKGSVYVVRTPGGTLPPVMIEALKLAVRNGVGLILLGDHHDCAARDATDSADGQATFPEIARELARLDDRYQQLVADPEIDRAIRAGRLRVFTVHHATDTQWLEFVGELGPHASARRD